MLEKKTKKKKIDLFVPQGVKDGEKQVLDGQGHALPDMPLGDVIIIYSVKPHKRYTRIQADLALQKELTLKEALCGYSFFIKHINGIDWIRIHSKPGQIVQPNSVIVLEGLGLPQKGNRSTRGNLYVRFNVILPQNNTLNKNNLIQIKNLLNVEYDMPNKEINDNREITIGSKVKLIGSKNRPDLNGIKGTVIQNTGRPGQFAVHLETGQNVAVRQELLELCEILNLDKEKDYEPKKEDYVEHVTGEIVKDFSSVQHTPAEYGKRCDDEEEEGERVGCKQM